MCCWEILGQAWMPIGILTSIHTPPEGRLIHRISLKAGNMLSSILLSIPMHSQFEVTEGFLIRMISILCLTWNHQLS